MTPNEDFPLPEIRSFHIKNHHINANIQKSSVVDQSDNLNLDFLTPFSPQSNFIPSISRESPIGGSQASVRNNLSIFQAPADCHRKYTIDHIPEGELEEA